MAFKKCKECGVLTLFISWSALRTFETCKQQNFLQKSGHRAQLQNTRVFFPGTVVDRVVRDWLLNDPNKNLGLMPDMVDEIIQREADLIKAGGGKMVWKDPEDQEKVRKDCIEAVKKIEPSLRKFVLPFEYDADFGFKAPVMVPHPSGGMQKVVLNGYMDIIVRDDQGRFAVWDVKMTKDNLYWKKTMGQIGFYDLVIEIMFGQPSVMSGLLQPMCDQPVKPIMYTADERSQLMQRIMRMANDVWLGNNEPRKDMSECSFCSVKHACTKFKPVNGRMSLLGLS